MLDLTGIKGLPLADVFQRVQGRLDGAPRRPLFDGRLHDTIELTEVIDHSRGIGFRIVGLDEIVGAGENVVSAGPAGMNDQGRVDAVARAHPAKDKCLLDVFGITTPGAYSGTRLLGGVIEQPAHLLRIETGRTSGRRSRAHCANKRMCLFHPRADGSHGPHGNVVAERDGPHEVRATDSELLAHG